MKLSQSLKDIMTFPEGETFTSPPPPPPRPVSPPPPPRPSGPTGPGRVIRRALQVQDLRSGDVYTSPVDKDPVYVDSIVVNPPGCHGNVHVNGTICYPLTAPASRSFAKRKARS